MRLGRSSAISVECADEGLEHLDDLDSLGKRVETGLDSYDRRTDTCCLLQDEGKGMYGVLIASMKGEKKAGKSSEIWFEKK